MDRCRDRLSACDPTEDPKDRQYEDSIPQALRPEFKAIRPAHLERGDFSLADVRRVMAAVYADKLARSRSGSFMGIAGRGAAMKAMVRDRNDNTSVPFVIVSTTSKAYATPRSKNLQKINGQQPWQREVSHANSTTETEEVDDILCGVI